MQIKTTHRIALTATTCILLILTVFARHNARKHVPSGKMPKPSTLKKIASTHTPSPQFSLAKKRHQSLKRRPTRPGPPPSPSWPPKPNTPLDISIDPTKELMITHLNVVEDPVRTNPRMGRRAVWTFKHLMTNMAGNNNPSTFVLNWLKHWESDQLINGKISPARPAITDQIIGPWLAASGGKQLNLDLAPFKLLAIVNRMDLRKHDEESVSTGGEGRFIFGVLKADGTPLPPIAGPATGGFTVIFEYELPAKNMHQLASWAEAWHGLKRHRLGDYHYNRELERITRQFTDRGRAPRKANGSAINQIRTNEFAIGPNWELREFTLKNNTGTLNQHPVALSPETISLNGTKQLSKLINDNEAKILDGTFQLPTALAGPGSIAGPFVPENFSDYENRTFTVIPLVEPFIDIPWSSAGILNNEARHRFALNTCHGCHRSETGTGFLQIGFPAEHNLPQSLQEEAQLAGFLTGIEVMDPVQPQTTIRTFNDLKRRSENLKELLEHLNGPRHPRPPRKPHHPHFIH